MSEHEQGLGGQHIEGDFAIALKKDRDNIYSVFLYDKSRLDAESPTFDPTELNESQYIAKLSFNQKTGQTIAIDIGLVQGSTRQRYEPKYIQKIVNYVSGSTNQYSLITKDEGRVALAAYISSAVSNQEKYLGETAPIRFCLPFTTSNVSNKIAEGKKTSEANKMMGEAIKRLTDELRIQRKDEKTRTDKKPPKFICIPYSAYTKNGRHVGAIICDLDAALSESMMYFDSANEFRESGVAKGEEDGSIGQAQETFGCLATERLKISHYSKELLGRMITEDKIDPINSFFLQKGLDCSYWVEAFNLTLTKLIEEDTSITNLDELKEKVGLKDFETKLKENLTILKETQRDFGTPLDGGSLPIERSVQLEVERSLPYQETHLMGKDNTMATFSNIGTETTVPALQEQYALSASEKTVNRISKSEGTTRLL